MKQHNVIGNAYPPRGLGLLYMKDGLSWYVNCTVIYLKTSGNYAYLDKVVGYKDGGADSIYVHLKKAIEHMWTDRGMFGMSLLGDGDWTDPINGPGRGGKGVSTWTTIAFKLAVKQFYDIAILKNDPKFAEKCRSMEKELGKIINDNCYT